MKRFFALSLLIAFSALALFACGDSEIVNAEDASESSGDVVLRVNDETLTATQLNERVDMKIQPMLQRFGVESTDELPPQVQGLRDQVKRQVINQSVTQLVLLSHARQSSVEVTDQELQERWDGLVERFPSEQQFRNQLEKMGKSPEEFRKDLKHSILIEKFAKQEIGEIEVSEQEIQQHFSENKEQYGESERVKARHILFKDEDGNDPQSEAESVKEELEGGADFAEMAEEHSDGPSAQRGGSLGTFSRGEMVPAFEKIAFSLEPGVISDPVQTQFGYHLIEVQEKMDSQPASLDSARDQIRQQLLNQKRQQRMQKLVQDLRKQSDIERNVDLPAPPQPQGRPGAGQMPGQ